MPNYNNRTWLLSRNRNKRGLREKKGERKSSLGEGGGVTRVVKNV